MDTNAGIQPSRRDRNKSSTRTRLLDAARRLFAEKGVAGTTIDDITDLADLGRATFFNHFAGKDAVLQALWGEQIAHFAQTVTTQLERPLSTAERLLNVFRAFEEAAELRPQYLRVVTGELERDGQNQSTGRQRIERFHAALRPLIEAGIAQGDVRSDRPPGFLTQVVGDAYLSVIRRWRLYPHEHLASHVGLAVEFFAQAIAPRP
ncbi:MAG: TetR/AcrR family transcriptional regulator [Burkholderiales bacterium]|nr:TetR/AcrR family transcriptional regulator [Burkholderiales bacterium]MDE1926431.1 TetR/AcrR family transcriptional regulator [Burkholderiales bacterium]MDE2158497.1 TetR/AcrR family transcriptional regulator [Burkholderiales bacterium]MDE2503810.1 TetR/AcrR family transcriptional regulator [Burkholderiales bacterium]